MKLEILEQCIDKGHEYVYGYRMARIDCCVILSDDLGRIRPRLTINILLEVTGVEGRRAGMSVSAHCVGFLIVVGLTCRAAGMKVRRMKR